MDSQTKILSWSLTLGQLLDYLVYHSGFITIHFLTPDTKHLPMQAHINGQRDDWVDIVTSVETSPPDPEMDRLADICWMNVQKVPSLWVWAQQSVNWQSVGDSLVNVWVSGSNLKQVDNWGSTHCKSLSSYHWWASIQVRFIGINEGLCLHLGHKISLTLVLLFTWWKPLNCKQSDSKKSPALE